MLLATPPFARIVFTPAISFAADRAGGRRPILIALAWGSLASFLLLWMADGFWQMLLASLLLAANWTTILPLVETVALTGIRRGALDYGKVRLWGSVSFIVASLGSGLIIGRLGPQTVLPLLVGGAALMVVGAHLVRHALARASHVPSALRRLSLSDAFKLLRAPLFLLFLLAASLIQSSHAVYYSFGSLNWRLQGISDGMIGVLWSVGVVTEVALFAVSGRIVAFCGAARLLMFAASAVLRWGFMAADPPLWATALLQTLHAMSFGVAHIAAIHFLTHAVPEDRAATAQGLYAAFVAGLVLGAVTVASGPLYRMFAGEAYAAMALLAPLGTQQCLSAHAPLAWRPRRGRASAPQLRRRRSNHSTLISKPGNAVAGEQQRPVEINPLRVLRHEQGRGHGERSRNHAPHHHFESKRVGVA